MKYITKKTLPIAILVLVALVTFIYFVYDSIEDIMQGEPEEFPYATESLTESDESPEMLELMNQVEITPEDRIRLEQLRERLATSAVDSESGEEVE